METYSARCQDLLDRIAELVRQMESSRAVFAISLDNTRNRLARMNLSLTLGTLSASFSMMVAGFFGMNITSGLEAEHPVVFAGVVSAGLAGSFIIYVVARQAWVRATTRQHQRMLDHRSFKGVLEKLDLVHQQLRVDSHLSRRLVAGAELTRAELRDLLHNACDPGGGSKNHLDHMSFYGAAVSSAAARARAGGRRGGGDGGAPREAAGTEAELEQLLDILITQQASGLMHRSDLLDELARWASSPHAGLTREPPAGHDRPAEPAAGVAAAPDPGKGSQGAADGRRVQSQHTTSALEDALQQLVLGGSLRAPPRRPAPHEAEATASARPATESPRATPDTGALPGKDKR